MRRMTYRFLLACTALATFVSTSQAQTPPAPNEFASSEDSYLAQSPPAPQSSTDTRRISSPEAETVYTVSGEPVAVNGTYDASYDTLVPSSQASIEQRLAELEKQGAAQKAAATKLPSITINGVFQADGVVFNQDAQNRADVGYIENGADFRRARLSAKGAVANNMNYFMQMDFGFFGRPTFTDVWMEWTDLPIFGNIRVGQWKQPFSLEVVSSFRYTTFMERSSLFQTFTPFRHIGIGFYNHSEDLNSTWAASYFRTGQDQFGSSLSTVGGNGFAGRVTHLLKYDEQTDGRAYWHVGAGYFFNSPPRDTVRYRSIPEIFAGEFASSAGNPVGTSGQALPNVFNGTPFFVDTLNVTQVTNVNTYGLESLMVYGAASLQAEAMAAVVNRSVGDTAVLPGAYVTASYFLTGEHRPYDRVAGAIDRVKPIEDFFWVRTADGCHSHGLGAWEVAARFSYIDLNDKTIQGGTMSDFTGGVNWYCNPYCKVVFNYIHSWLDYRTGTNSEANAFGMRAQVDF